MNFKTLENWTKSVKSRHYTSEVIVCVPTDCPNFEIEYKKMKFCKVIIDCKRIDFSNLISGKFTKSKHR